MTNSKYFFCILFFVLLISCVEKSIKLSDDKPIYDVYVRCGNEHDEFLVRVNDFSSGNIDPRKDGAKVSEEIHYGMTVQGDSYFYLNEKTHRIKKYQIIDHIFTQVDSLPVTKIQSLESILWISKDSLLMFGLDKDFIRPAYAMLETKNMSLVSEGTLDIPNTNKMEWSSIGFLQRRNNDLFIGYYSKAKKNKEVKVFLSNMEIAVLNFPEMNNLRIISEQQFGRSLNDNRYQPSSVQTESGDIYFLSCASDRIIEQENHSNKLYSSIYRIQDGQTQVDQDYLFNISESAAQGHVYGIWYINKEKAIIKCDVPSRIKSWDDYDEYAYTYFEVNLKDKTLHKLNLPLDRGWYLDNVLVEDELVYIANKSETNENYIWIYNTQTKNLAKGLRVNGDIEYFRRINRVK